MVLVDACIWIDYLRKGDAALGQLLDANRVLMHPFVLGELALGGGKQRKDSWPFMVNLPSAEMADNWDVINMLDGKKMVGIGIGFVDAHLVASTILENGKLYTRDKRLAAVAANLKIQFQ